MAPHDGGVGNENDNNVVDSHVTINVERMN